MYRKKLVSAIAASLFAVSASVPQAVLADETAAGEMPAVLDPIVVTATRLEVPERELASSVTVISRKEIEASQQTTVFDVLRGRPALDVVHSGSPGGNAAVFVRGAKAQHTLVMIDGIEAGDPVSPDRAANLGNMSVDSVERIEILRGPQSTLYGSDAVGGVINIITRRGAGRPKAFALTEGGTYGTSRTQAGFSGGSERVNYSVESSRVDIAGFSSADERLGNSERDRYGSTSVGGRLGFSPAKNASFDVLSHYNTSRSGLDASAGDDPNYVADARELFLRGQGRLALAGGSWDQRAGFSFARHNRDYRDDTDPIHPLDSSRASYRGSVAKADWQHDLRVHPSNTVTLGAELEEEIGASEFASDSSFGPFVSKFDRKTARTNGYYLQDQARVGDVFFATLGGRLDDHERFGSAGTYRATAAFWPVPSVTKLKATYGTGFKAPTLFELFSAFGDPDLDPERSKGWDAGFEQSFHDGRGSFGATFFRNDFNHLIVYDSGTGQYKNVDKASSHGVEFTGRWRPVNSLALSANHTITETKDAATGEQLIRRPRNKSGAAADYDVTQRANLHLGVNYVGKRKDTDFNAFPAQNITLGSYTLINVGASFEIVSHFRLFGRVEDLLDKSYEEVLGFGTPGRTVTVGAKVSF